MIKDEFFVHLHDMNCYVFVEQKANVASTISKKLVQELTQIGAVRTKEQNIYFLMTGFIEVGGHLFVILPKGYKLNSPDKFINEDIRILFAVLMKYREEVKPNFEEMTLFGGEMGDFEDSLFSAYSLLEDYKMYGLLKREHRIMSSKMTGNTVWSATINKKTPMFSSGNPIYYEVIKRSSVLDNENLLLQLHKFALGWSLKKYAWLLGQYKELISAFSIELPCDKQQALHFLNNELRKTYILRETNVIKWIINIITGVNSSVDEIKVRIFATKTFHTVWEEICSKIFHDQYAQLKTLLPQPEWTLDIPVSQSRISQRPDIMILHNNRMLILDAKYYDVESDLPGWHDAVKQFFYALSTKINIAENVEYLQKKELREKAKNIIAIENIFILPTFNDIEMMKIGSISVNGISEFGKINAYVLNMRLSMKCYIGEQHFPLQQIVDNF